jgi:hypothetical protein
VTPSLQRCTTQANGFIRSSRRRHAVELLHKRVRVGIRDRHCLSSEGEGEKASNATLLIPFVSYSSLRHCLSVHSTAVDDALTSCRRIHIMDMIYIYMLHCLQFRIPRKHSDAACIEEPRFTYLLYMYVSTCHEAPRNACTMHEDEGRKMWLMCCKSCD